MDWLEALILGIVQGLTEFLPVSSSGHLELGKVLFNLNLAAADSLTFDVFVHGGTALSTIVVFRKEIRDLLGGALKFTWNNETKFITYIVLSMIPAAIVGLAFEDQITQLFDGQVMLVGIMLLVTSALLLLADYSKKTDKNVAGVSALVIGIAQAIAILPGMSRSGATISTSVLLGIDREQAARFSFLMVLPLIIGKALVDVRMVYSTGGEDMKISVLALFIGFLAAFISGLFACKWMISLVKRAKLKYFALYCFLLGSGVLIYLYL